MSPSSTPRAIIKQDIDVNTPTILHKQNSAKRVEEGRAKFTGTCRFRLPKRAEILPMRYLQHIGHKVATALSFVSRRKASPKDRSSSGRAKPFVAPVDSHRAEAIDDCIEFINSSSSLQKSKSMSE